MRTELTFAMRHIIAAGAIAVTLCVTSAHAQSVSRGQALYEVLGCGTSSCHGANPTDNLYGLLNGAGSPAAIEFAATVRSEMQYLLATFNTDPSAAVDLAAWLANVAATMRVPPATALPPVSKLVEFLHATFGHYFVTNNGDDISAIDSGVFVGWARTGRTINAYESGHAALAPVCRFFTDKFAPKSSHFYTADAVECAGLKAGTVWQFEGERFFAPVPDAVGACTTGLLAVDRLYNAGQGGAPNHRYTTDAGVRSEMIARGWIAEGVRFCAPP